MRPFSVLNSIWNSCNDLDTSSNRRRRNDLDTSSNRRRRYLIRQSRSSSFSLVLNVVKNSKGATFFFGGARDTNFFQGYHFFLYATLFFWDGCKGFFFRDRKFLWDTKKC